MYNTKFIMVDGKEVYPGYITTERRQQMRDKYKDAHGYMRCGCRPGANLYYRISEDLRIYPEHKNYQHDKYCCRYKDSSGASERQTAYMISDENGDVVAFTSFDPLSFVPKASDTPKEQDNLVTDDDAETLEELTIGQDDEVKPTEKKEPKLSVEDLIRSINVDCFTEKILNNQEISSAEKFAVFVYYRMKKVRLFRTKKYIGELSLEKDGCRFVYLPFVGILKNEVNGATKCYLQTKGKDGKIYNNFIFPETMEKAVKAFTKAYGTQPDEHTMVAGFQYFKKTKNGGYKVMGRIHLFQTSDIGIYCRSMKEVNTFNSLQQIATENEDIRYWIPPEDPGIGGIVEIKGETKKILLLFSTGKDEHVVYDSSMYIPLVIRASTNLTEDMLYELLEKEGE